MPSTATSGALRVVPCRHERGPPGPMAFGQGRLYDCARNAEGLVRRSDGRRAWFGGLSKHTRSEDIELPRFLVLDS